MNDNIDRILRLTVEGIPAPQGSKSGRAIYRGTGDQRQFTGKVAMHESSKKVAPWRQAVKSAALNTVAEIPGWQPYDELVEMAVTFWFERPKSHYRSGRNAHLLKDGATSHVGVYPDLDKLLRSTLDALGSKTGAGVIRNDSQVVRFTSVEKRYAGGRPAGADITIAPLSTLVDLTEQIAHFHPPSPDELALFDPDPLTSARTAQ